MTKQAKCSSPKPVLSFDIKSRTVTGPGSNGKKIRSAIEDVRHATSENYLARAVQGSIDELEKFVQSTIQVLE